EYPSSAVSTLGNSPCQILHRWRPPGVKSSPQGYIFCSRPPRAAYSHSASVGRRLPAQRQYSVASFQETCVTGYSWRHLTFEPGPSGCFQYAPRTLHHHVTPRTVSSTNSREMWVWKTKDQSNFSASVRYLVALTNSANWRFVTGYVSM